jgi:hypothetical protein
VLGRDFIGPREIYAIASKLGVQAPDGASARIPPIPIDFVERASTHVLILGSTLTADLQPLTINRMRAFLGTEASVKEPCFYNQDWYLREAFADTATIEARWYLIQKEVAEGSRGRDPEDLASAFAPHGGFPSAILACYAFFAYYLHTGGDLLWKNTFVWCSDRDHNDDRIYVGRYVDPGGVNKNGFNIHRHLRIRSSYGAIAAMALP